MLAFISKNKISLPLALFNGLVACWLAGFTNLSFYRNISQLSSYQGMSNYLFVFVTFILLSSFYFCVAVIELAMYSQATEHYFSDHDGDDLLFCESVGG